MDTSATISWRFSEVQPTLDPDVNSQPRLICHTHTSWLANSNTFTHTNKIAITADPAYPLAIHSDELNTGNSQNPTTGGRNIEKPHQRPRKTTINSHNGGGNRASSPAHAIWNDSNKHAEPRQRGKFIRMNSPQRLNDMQCPRAQFIRMKWTANSVTTATTHPVSRIHACLQIEFIRMNSIRTCRLATPVHSNESTQHTNRQEKTLRSSRPSAVMRNHNEYFRRLPTHKQAAGKTKSHRARTRVDT